MYLTHYELFANYLHLSGMKTLSTFRYLLLVPSFSLLGHASNAKKEAILPAETHVVQVRVTGQNLAGLGAELVVRSSLNWNPRTFNPGPGFTKSIGNSVNETYTVGTFGPRDYVEASVAFKNVAFHNNTRPPAGAHLWVEIITDGKGGEKTRLDANAVNDKAWKVEYNPYLKGTVAVETDKL